MTLATRFVGPALSREASYAQGMTALGTLLVLHVAVAGGRRRLGFLARLLEFEPPSWPPSRGGPSAVSGEEKRISIQRPRDKA